jgi:hypothetical protein
MQKFGLELHPDKTRLIEFGRHASENLSYIARIRKVYQHFIGINKPKLMAGPTLSVLQIWTQEAELDVAAELYDEAFISLATVTDAFRRSAYPREFVRVARLLLEHLDWARNFGSFRKFETVFGEHVYLLSELGENKEVDRLLEKYSETVPNKNARYIGYCDISGE